MQNFTAILDNGHQKSSDGERSVLIERMFGGWGAGKGLTRSRLVFSRTSTNFSTLVRGVKMKSSSTHRTYLVVTWEMARFLPANQP